MPPIFLVYPTASWTPVARFDVAHHAHAKADELTRETGIEHRVFRQARIDSTRPAAVGKLVSA